LIHSSSSVVLAVVLAIAARTSLCAEGNITPAEARLFDGETAAPEFPGGMQWFNSPGPLSIRQFRGKFVLLDFWTYCCINCMHLVPDLRKLENKYAQELVVLGVHSAKFENEKQSSQIREAILRYGVRHPVVNDDGLAIWRRYMIQGWPTLVLINPEGRIVARITSEQGYASVDPILVKAVPYFAARGRLHRSPVAWPLEAARRPDTLLAYPGKISADTARHRLIVSDSNHNRILITDDSGKLLTTIGTGAAGRVDGPFDRAEFDNPQGTAIAGDRLYIADTGNHAIRVASLASGKVSTLLGTGEQAHAPIPNARGPAVALDSPWDIAIDQGRIYIAMAGSHQLFVYDPDASNLTLLAGSGAEGLSNGAPLKASLAQPSGLAIDGGTIYFADSESSSIRALGLATGAKIATLIGKGLFEFGDVDGGAGKARLQHPLGIAVHDGRLYVADTYNGKIKLIDPSARTCATFAGNGVKKFANGGFAESSFNEPGGLAWLDDKLYVADTDNQQVRVLDPAAKTINSFPIRGLDTLVTSQIKRFSGRIVNLGERRVNPGRPELAVNVSLPSGYKLNPEAPFFLQWKFIDSSGTESVAKLEKQDRFPAMLPLGDFHGSPMIEIETVIYYCIDTATTCYVDPVQARVNLIAADDGSPPAGIIIPAKQPSLQ
jgi:DNA-binding beta-propeller fold protein YncE